MQKKNKTMEQQNNITAPQAFEIIFQVTGQLQLNRKDSEVLNNSLRVLAALVAAQEQPEQKTNESN